MRKGILNKIMAAAIAYAMPLVINYIVNRFFSKKQKPDADKSLTQK